MEKILVCLTFFASILALLFVAVTAKKVLKASEGNETMKKITFRQLYKILYKKRSQCLS